jgi:predicted ATPase with chaperone activity
LISILSWAIVSRWQLTAYRGALPIAIKAKEEERLFFKANVKEAAIVTGLDVYGVENVQEVIDFLGKKFRTYYHTRAFIKI